MNRPDSMAKTMPKIAELKLPSCGLNVADFRKNCDYGVAVAEQHSFKKLQNCDCGSASVKLRNYDCGLNLNNPKTDYLEGRLYILSDQIYRRKIYFPGQ
jgi:hypothetical protein